MKLSRIKKSTLTDKIVELLYEKITKGEIKAGEKLPGEVELAEQLGVGRPTIREAFNRLLGLGLVERTGYTMTIANDATNSVHSRMVPLILEQWETRQLFEARKLIEGDLAILAARKATPSDFIELRLINEQMANNTSVQQYWTLDMQFHKKIADLTDNDVLLAMNNILHDMFRKYEKDVEELLGVHSTTYSDHTELIDAMEMNKEDQIRAIINRSLSASEQALVELRESTKQSR